MKPAWDKLIEEFAGSKTALVADVDCTTDESTQLCEQQDVEGFPTIKWGDPSNLEDYDGGREFKELQKFAKENLKPLCSPSNIDLCDAEKKKQIEELMAMTVTDLEAKIEEKEKKQKDAEELFIAEAEKLQKKYEELEEEEEAEKEKLQKKYEKLEKKKKKTIQAVKDSGLFLMKAVKIATQGKAEL